MIFRQVFETTRLGDLGVLGEMKGIEPLAEIAKGAKEEYAWYIRPAWISNLNMLGVLYVLGERMTLAEIAKDAEKERIGPSAFCEGIGSIP